MDANSATSLLRQLLACATSADVSDVLRALGDRPDQALDTPFGSNELRWIAFGKNPSNVSTIGLGTKPGKSLTERVTNAIDALLEERAVRGGRDLPSSPQEAAQRWFGRPQSGPDQGLFQGLQVSTDKRIHVVLQDSGDIHAPTIDVVDEGIGIAPKDFYNTILSLQAGNKIRKKYLIGAFGQGGAATLGFSDYVIIVSRPSADPATVGFTVIRVLRLDKSYKEDCYAYLATSGGDAPEVVTTRLENPAALVEMPTDYPLAFAHGTLVRHVRYKLDGIEKSLGPSPGNLYHYLHYSIFDPLLPFRILDARVPSKARNELITGSRNRLMRLVGLERSDIDNDEEARVQIAHYRPMEYIAPLGATEPVIGVEYWVVLAYRKKDDARILRGNSSELFVDGNYPIIGTLNGQTQGELSAGLLREAGLTLLSRHMIVHIDASAADSQIRRQLFSSSREGFKDGPVLTAITRSLRQIIEDDTDLKDLEQQLTERLAKRDAAQTREEVRLQVSRLLKESGFAASVDGPADRSGTGDPQQQRRTRANKPVNAVSLPTLPFPEVSRFSIVFPEDLLQVHVGDNELIVVETDADAEYDVRGLIHIRTEPPALEVDTKSRLKNGRLRWRLRPREGIAAGTAGELLVTLTKLDGSQFKDSRAFEVLPAIVAPAKKAPQRVPPFEIRPISPIVDSETWGLVWADDIDDQAAQLTHAYKAIRNSETIIVFYSTVFPPYAAAKERLKKTSMASLHLFETQYEVWIAYHAILQYQTFNDRMVTGLADDRLEANADEERALVAMMQVKQATAVAELLSRAQAAQK